LLTIEYAEGFRNVSTESAPPVAKPFARKKVGNCASRSLTVLASGELLVSKESL
jgi:hypothetical protein